MLERDRDTERERQRERQRDRETEESGVETDLQEAHDKKKDGVGANAPRKGFI